MADSVERAGGNANLGWVEIGILVTFFFLVGIAVGMILASLLW